MGWGERREENQNEMTVAKNQKKQYLIKTNCGMDDRQIDIKIFEYKSRQMARYKALLIEKVKTGDINNSLLR